MSVSDEFMSFLDDLKKKSFMRVFMKIWFVFWYCFVYFAIFPPKVIYRKGALKNFVKLTGKHPSKIANDSCPVKKV